MDKNYCRTATTKILGTTLCCHCGEEVQVRLGHPHKHEDDEDYCTCAGSIEELGMRKEQSKLRNQVDKIENDIGKLLRKNEFVFNRRADELECRTLNDTLKRKYRVTEEDA